MFEKVTQKINNNKDYRMSMVNNMLSSRSATTLEQNKHGESSPFSLWEKWNRRPQLRKRHNYMLQAHEPWKSLLRKHPIDSDVKFQVEVEPHGDKNFMNDGQFRILKDCVSGNLTASFAKCYSSKNWGLALTLRMTPSVLNSSFNL